MKLSRVILTTVVVTLTVIAVIAVLFGGWRAYNHVRESDPVEQAKRISAELQEKARVEMAGHVERIRSLDLDSFELKRGLQARIKLQAAMDTDPKSSDYVSACLDDALPSKCRMNWLEREYERIAKGWGHRR